MSGVYMDVPRDDESMHSEEAPKETLEKPSVEEGGKVRKPRIGRIAPQHKPE
ncbi:MAG: hypothetical protein QW176_05010 [Candidatus Bathyarchaeia archaeon]